MTKDIDIFGDIDPPKNNVGKVDTSWDVSPVDIEEEFSDVVEKSVLFDEETANDLSKILSLEPAVLRAEASAVHGAIMRWSSEVSELGKHMKLLKLARDTREKQVSGERRATLQIRGDRITEGALQEVVYQDAQFLALKRAKIDAEAEYEKAKGVLSGLFTKREMLKALMYSMGNSARYSDDPEYDDDETPAF